METYVIMRATKDSLDVEQIRTNCSLKEAQAYLADLVATKGYRNYNTDEVVTPENTESIWYERKVA